MRYKLAFDYDKERKFRVTVMPLLENNTPQKGPYVCRFNSHGDFIRRITASHLSPFNTAKLLQVVIRIHFADQPECCEEIGLTDEKLEALGLAHLPSQVSDSEAA